VNILRRLLAYGRVVLQWDAPLAAVGDRRKQGRIATASIVRAIMAMSFCRLGSLNSLGQTRGSWFWRKWLGADLPSPDTIGRVAALVDVASLRALGHHVYQRLKRGKALRPPAHGLMAAIVDAHETHAGYKRHCAGCLERIINTAHGECVQYYHRLVALSLTSADLNLLLDAEPMLRGEDEVASALRLLDRVGGDYPRAFDIIQGDALYADPRFFDWAMVHGKHALAVLKNDRRDLLQDARRLFAEMAPRRIDTAGRRRETWDLEGFTSWPQVGVPVRVVRSRETRGVRRQLDGQLQEEVSDWYWVTTLPAAEASTGAIVAMGHRRWDIENQGFNELANHYHADHVYRHEPTALLVFWLLLQICLNIFSAFFRRNLKPAARAVASMLHIARLVQAEFFLPLARAPTRGNRSHPCPGVAL